MNNVLMAVVAIRDASGKIIHAFYPRTLDTDEIVGYWDYIDERFYPLADYKKAIENTDVCVYK